MEETVKERVARHRGRLAKAGMRPIQIWVPDTRKPAFAAECRRQSLSLRGDSQEGEILAFIAEAADTEGWE